MTDTIDAITIGLDTLAGVRGHGPRRYVPESHLDAANARIAELEGHLRWFCDRRDAGEVRSTKTYERFRATLMGDE